MRAKHCFLGALCWLVGREVALAQWDGREAVRSLVTIVDVDGSSKRVIHTANHRLEAPSWAPDGSFLVLNGGGKLWRLSMKGGDQPRAIATDRLGWIDVNHGISPDGLSLAVTAGPIFRLAASGGKAVRLTSGLPRYFHGWGPNGAELAYAMVDGGNVDIGAVDLRTGAERRLTTNRAIDDTPTFSADGRSIFFSSTRSGGSDIWRIPAEGLAPADARAVRVTDDAFQDWFPHASLDGRSLIFLSYHKSIEGHPTDQDVRIRRMAVGGSGGLSPNASEAKVTSVARFVGGQGSLGSRPWSPDGRQFVYVSYETPAPQLHIVFFTPAGVRAPPGMRHRLTKVADAAERFFLSWMKHWGYPPSNEHLFTRERDGSARILEIQGNLPASDPAYLKPNFATFGPEIIARATTKYHVAGDSHVWWIFTYLGDPPMRISEYRGARTLHGGGWAVVNYLSSVGEIEPSLGLETGFNKTFTLKGCIHELGHALGLPHIGPVPSLGLGDSLMGPNNAEYAARGLPDAQGVYLTEAGAAMLWKHPIFSGDARRRALMPEVELSQFRAAFERGGARVTVSGKVRSDLTVHSAIVLDDLGRPEQEYWFRSAVSRVGSDGQFAVRLKEPGRTDGHFRILFAFDNGVVSGDWARPEYYGAIVKPYHMPH